MLDGTYGTRSWKPHDVTGFKQAFKFQAWSIIVETHKNSEITSVNYNIKHT